MTDKISSSSRVNHHQTTVTSSLSKSRFKPITASVCRRRIWGKASDSRDRSARRSSRCQEFNVGLQYGERQSSRCFMMVVSEVIRPRFPV